MEGDREQLIAGANLPAKQTAQPAHGGESAIHESIRPANFEDCPAVSRPLRARPRRGLLNGWAGDSLWRRFVAWVAQSAALVVVAAVIFAAVWFVLVPWMTNGFIDVMQSP